MENILGISEEAYTESTGSTVSEGFKPTPSGIVKATVEQVATYQDPKFKQTMFRLTFKLVDGDRVVSYRSGKTNSSDIGTTIKPTAEQEAAGQPGSENGGYVARVKSVLTAANMEMSGLSFGKKEKGKDNFGREVELQLINGLNGKTVEIALRESHNSNLPEGAQYRESNDVEGVVNTEEEKEKFLEKVAKNNGIFLYAGYVKGAATGGDSKSKEDAKADSDAAGKVQY